MEGQGSLFHPSFAGVSLGLLHGAQPDAIVLCHEPTRVHMRGLPHQPLPELRLCVEANLEAARLVSKEVKCVGIAVNTKDLSDDEANKYPHTLEETHGIPCTDPIRTGVASIVDRLID